MQLSDFQKQLTNALKDIEFLTAIKSIISGSVFPTAEPEPVIRYNERELKFKKNDPRAKAPSQTEGSAGYDLFPLDAGWVNPGQSVTLDTGLAMEFEDDLAALLVDRSGMGLRGIIRRAGLIDANYRGPWTIILYNSGKEPIPLTPEKACIQILFLEKIRFRKITEVTELSETSRGAGGFGSSDKKGVAE